LNVGDLYKAPWGTYRLHRFGYDPIGSFVVVLQDVLNHSAFVQPKIQRLFGVYLRIT